MSHFLHAQCTSMKAAGSAMSEDVRAVVQDISGNMYVVGQFNKNTEIEGVALVNPYASNSIFIAKYSYNGLFLSVAQIDCNGDFAVPPRAAWLNNNLYIALTLSGTLYQGSTTWVTNAADILVLKTDENAAIQQVALYGGAGNDVARDIEADPWHSALLLAGHFEQNLSFGGISLGSSSGQDGFIARLDESLAALWAKRLASVGDCAALDLDVNASQTGVCGYFFGDMTLTPGFHLVNPVSDYAAFALTMTEDGVVTWVTSSVSVTPDGYCAFNSIAVEGTEEVYVTGDLNGQRNIQGALFTPGSGNAVLLKFKGTLQWARQAGASTDSGTKVITDHNSQVYWAGIVNNAMRLDGALVQTFASRSVFLAKLDPAGTPRGILASGGLDAAAYEIMENVYADQVLLAGVMGGSTIRFGNDSLPNPAWNTPGDQRAVFIYQACPDLFLPFLPKGNYYTQTQQVIAGDFDNDGDADAFVYHLAHSLHLKNNNFDFTLTPIDLSGLGPFIDFSAATAADADRDGDIDILQTGESGGQKTYMLRNQAGQFKAEDITASVPGLSGGEIHWVDFDRDADPDIFLTGERSGALVTTLFENTKSGYVATPGVFHLFKKPQATFDDLDKDGDPDLLLMGVNTAPFYKIYRYQNVNNLYFLVDSTTLQGANGDLETGDLDDDGDPDLVIAGAFAVTPSTTKSALRIFYNNGAGIFTLFQEIPDIWASGDSVVGSIHIIDIDNDGKRDIVMGAQAKVFSFQAGKYVPGHLGVRNEYPYFDLADFDGDHKIDIFARQSLGTFWNQQRFQAFQNNTYRHSAPPQSPSNINVSFQDADATFSWSPGADDHTPAGSLGYNICVGTAPGKGDLLACNSAPSGDRRIWDGGNVRSGTSFTLHNIPPGDYYVSVQSIDGHYNGSAFASKPFTVVLTLAAPNLISPANQATEVPIRPEFRWTPVPNAGRYLIQVSLNAAFNDIAVEKTTVGAAFDTLVLPNCQTKYYWRVQSQANGYLGAWSNIFSFTTCPIFSRIDTLTLAPGLKIGQIEFVDIDNDLDADLAALAYKPDGSHHNVFTIFFKNNAGKFEYTSKTDSVFALTHTDSEIPKMSWADRDNDGDYDLLLSGFLYKSSHFFENNAGVFTAKPSGNFPEARGEPVWFDANNDNRPDLLLPVTCDGELYVGQPGGGSALPQSLGLNNCNDTRIQAFDYDNDGRQDLAVFGGVTYTALLHNEGNLTLSKAPTGSLVWAANGDTEAADVDLDGDLDLLVTGYSFGSNWSNRLYINNGGTFLSPVGIPGPNTLEAAFSDFDRDGDPDLLLAGWQTAGGIYRNTGGQFSLFYSLPVSPFYTGADFNDFDNDGDEDLACAFGDHQIFLYINNEGRSIYDHPFKGDAPNLLGAVVNGNDATLSFKGSFQKGPEPFNGTAATYNLAVGTAPGLVNIVSPLSDLATGQPVLPTRGNIGSQETYTLKNLAPGTYYWTVQSISPGLVGSPFATPQAFTIETVDTEEPYLKASAFLVYPNPASDAILVARVGAPDSYSAHCYDQTGKLLYQGYSNEAGPLHIPCAAFPAGMYILRLSTGGEVEWRKVMVQR